MTVSKRSTSWSCVIAALTLLASPVATAAQQTAGASQAGAERRATGAPQATGAEWAGAPQATGAEWAGAQRRAAGAERAGAPQAAGAERAGAQRRAAGAPQEAGAERAGAQRRAPQEAGAQRRAAGARAGGPVRRARPVVQTRAWYGPGYGYHSPFFHPTYLYAPQWGPYSFGPWGPYPYYRGYYYRERGSVRLQVKPEETEVYVDGYYAGVVDSYDGFFQRLSLPPGRHDIELRLEGYRSIQEQIYLAVGQSYRIEHLMEPLGPGETTTPPPVPRDEPEVEPGLEPDPFARPGADPPMLSLAPVAGFGRLVVRVQPADASIFVDGEEWYSPDGSRLELEVGVGRHRIEVRREGYEAYVTDVTVRDGEPTAVNISLPRSRAETPEEPEPGAGA